MKQQTFFKHFFRCPNCHTMITRVNARTKPDFGIINCPDCAVKFGTERHIGSDISLASGEINIDLICASVFMASYIDNKGDEEIFSLNDLADSAIQSLQCLKKQFAKEKMK